MTFNLWSIQHKHILDIINDKGVYQPILSLQNGGKPDSAYKFILDCFNKLNNSNYPGFIFCLAKAGADKYFSSVDEVYSYFLEKPDVANAFNFFDSDHVILQLNYSESFNMIPIDFNDFIYIMPPSDNYDIAEMIRRQVATNNYHGAVVLKSFTQIHVPYIGKDNIVKIYPNLDRVNSKIQGEIVTF